MPQALLRAPLGVCALRGRRRCSAWAMRWLQGSPRSGRRSPLPSMPNALEMPQRRRRQLAVALFEGARRPPVAGAAASEQDPRMARRRRIRRRTAGDVDASARTRRSQIISGAAPMSPTPSDGVEHERRWAARAPSTLSGSPAAVHRLSCSCGEARHGRAPRVVGVRSRPRRHAGGPRRGPRLAALGPGAFHPKAPRRQRTAHAQATAHDNAGSGSCPETPSPPLRLPLPGALRADVRPGL